MVFDPKLETNFRFNEPTGGGTSAIGVIGGLVEDFLSVESKMQGGGREPTADEKFAMDFQQFTNDKGAAFKLDRGTLREFVFKYPQHSSKAMDHAKNLGVMAADPVEQTVDASMKQYATDPRFMTAAIHASNLPVEQREAYMSQAYSNLVAEDAEIAKLEKDKSKLEAEGTLTSKRWDVIAPLQKDYADNVVSTIVQPLLRDIMSGQAVELSPEEQATLGVRYSKVDKNNLKAVLMDTRNFIARQNRETYYNKFGTDGGLPPKEWEERALAGIDTLIKTSEEFDTPDEQVKMMNALIEADAIGRLDKAGLSFAMWGMKNLPETVASSLMTDANLNKKFAEVFTIDEQGEVDETKIPTNVQAMSSKDAESVAKMSLEAIGKGGSNSAMFSVFKEAVARSGYGVLDGESFKTLIGQSTNWMKKKASEDPAFREQTQDYFLSDINQTVTAMRRRLPPSAVLSYQNGRFTIIMESTQYGANAALPGGKDIPTVSNENLPLGLRVEDLNSKLASLKVLGPMGQEIVDTVVQQELNPNGVRGAAGDSNLPGNPGADTLVPPSLIVTESGGNFKAQNSVQGAGGKGHFGRLQFSQARLKEAQAAGVMPKGMSPQDFLNNPDVQKSVEAWHFTDIRKFAENNDLTKYIGGDIKGVPVTMDGILAVAHLGGKGGLKKFLESGGEYNPSDAFGTSLLDYLNTHQGSTGGFTAGEAPTLNTEGATATSAPQGTPAAGAPQMASGGVSEPLASPKVEQLAGETPEVSEDVKAKALAYIKSKPMDAEVKALIEALIGAKNV